MNAKPQSPRLVKCPRCSKGVAWSTENRYRPFCSERCRQIDLGAWANEEYRVAGSEPVEDDPEGMGRA